MAKCSCCVLYVVIVLSTLTIVPNKSEDPLNVQADLSLTGNFESGKTGSKDSIKAEFPPIKQTSAPSTSPSTESNFITSEIEWSDHHQKSSQDDTKGSSDSPNQLPQGSLNNDSSSSRDVQGVKNNTGIKDLAGTSNADSHGLESEANHGMQSHASISGSSDDPGVPNSLSDSGKANILDATVKAGTDSGVLNDLDEPSKFDEQTHKNGNSELETLGNSLGTVSNGPELPSEAEPSHPGFKTSQLQPHDEPSEPNEPDSVEVEFTDDKWGDEKEPFNELESDISHDVNNETVEANHKTESIDSDKMFGNPPILSEKDLTDLANKIPDDLSSKERELWREKISNSLGLSAVDPGLSMLPGSQDSQTPKPERSSTSNPVSALLYSSSTRSTVESNRLIPEKSVKGEEKVNTSGQVIVSNPDKQPAEFNDNLGDNVYDDGDSTNLDINGFDGVNTARDDENEGYQQKENLGRKVMNENDSEDYKTNDDESYEYKYDSNFFEDFDKDEDDYIGGEVFETSSPWPAQYSSVPGDQTDDPTRNFKKSKDFGDKDSGLQVDSSQGEELKQGDYNQDFDYEEDDDDDDWYYRPGGREDVKDVDLAESSSSFSPATSKPANSVPQQNEIDSGDKLTESKTQIGAPEFKEGVINKEDVPTKKMLQGPKGTIILYTVVIVILIACFVVFTVWKNPFKTGRPGHQGPVVRAGEEGKRLLDHPFV